MLRMQITPAYFFITTKSVRNHADAGPSPRSACRIGLHRGSLIRYVVFNEQIWI